jgi:hypothetical protein
MRPKTPTFIKLERRVARFVQRCAWCGHLVAPLDAVYVPCVGDRALSRHCSERCASYAIKVPMRVVYSAVAA